MEREIGRLRRQCAQLGAASRHWRTRTAARVAMLRWRLQSVRPPAWLRTRRLSFARRGGSTAMLLMGVLLLGYVAWNYGSMFFQQHQLEAEWQRQQEMVLPPDEAAAPAATLSKADVALKFANPLTRLTIPSIGLDAIVIPGSDEKALKIGPGWMTDTAEPGEPGNSVISGHRDTFFRHIVELKKGDVVKVSRAGRVYQYEVTGKKIVSPDDLSVLRPTKDRELTLITCYPTYYIGPAPDRLIVFTKAVDPEEATAKAAGTLR